jgi:hypothetical protein
MNEDEMMEMVDKLIDLADEADRILLRTHDDALPADVRALLERLAGAV